MTLPGADAIKAVDVMSAFARSRLIKVGQTGARRRGQKLLADVGPKMADDLAAYFRSFARRALPLSKADSIKWDPNDDIDWDAEQEELSGILQSWYVTVGTDTYDLVSQQLGAAVSWDLGSSNVASILDQIATRVVGITDTSRDALRRLVAIATDKGYSIDELVNGVAGDGFSGLKDLVSGWASTTGDSTSRAQTIATTETATAYNLASTSAYRDSGLVDEVEAFDGEGCGLSEHDDPDYPDGVDGLTFSLDDADEYPTAHPNCQRAWGPVAAR